MELVRSLTGLSWAQGYAQCATMCTYAAKLTGFYTAGEPLGSLTGRRVWLVMRRWSLRISRQAYETNMSLTGLGASKKKVERTVRGLQASRIVLRQRYGAVAEERRASLTGLYVLIGSLCLTGQMAKEVRSVTALPEMHWSYGTGASNEKLQSLTGLRGENLHRSLRASYAVWTRFWAGRESLRALKKFGFAPT